VTGGYSDAVFTSIADTRLFSPATGVWSAAGAMSEARDSHTATLLGDGRVLVAGGLDQGPYVSLAGAELYTPATGAWAPTGSLATGRDSHTATLLLDGRVLVTGGWDETTFEPLASAEIYDPKTGLWSPTGSMAVARAGHTATLLYDGHVLIVGGQGDSGFLRTAEVYEPANDGFASAGSTIWPRVRHAATLLLDGRVLIAGGHSGSGRIASAEIFDPIAYTWTPTANLSVTREAHTATTLPDARVLVAGGFSGSANLQGAEILTLPAGPPGQPRNVVAAPGDQMALVSWTPPAWNGGSPITSYTVQAEPGAINIGVSASLTTVPLDGLVNGVPYTFRVRAWNALGSGLWSYPSPVAVPQGGATAPDATSASLGPDGGTATTDPAAAGPTGADPIETTVAVPPGAGGGEVTIAESTASSSAPAGYQFLGQQIEITATAGTTAANPLSITFTIDASLLAGLTPASIAVFRSEDGGAPVLVPNCTGAPGVASPDPCVASRAYVGGTGDVAIAVLTSHASLWNLAASASGGCPAVCDDGDPCTQDVCDQATHQCRFDPVTCDDGDACTIDSCGTLGCTHTTPVPGAPGPILFTSQTVVSWPGSGAGASHSNTYRGTIPSQMLGSRLPGALYDTLCFESADAAGNGAQTSADAAVPAPGSAFFYLVSGESDCAESPLGFASSGAAIPNGAPCPTPP